MRRLYLLRDDMAVKGRWHVGEVLASDGSEPLLDAGISCQKSDLIANVTHPGRSLDFFVTAFNAPVATKKLADAIAEVANGDLQRIPIRISDAPGFEVLNAVRLVQCIDEMRSTFTKWTERDQRPDLVGQYRQVTKLTVDPRAVPSDAHFFRLLGWTVALVVSERVKVTMERAGCAGALFREVTNHLEN